MVEEIITALARIRWLFVIARNSSFTYKGQSVDVKRVGRELGVRYVLELPPSSSMRLMEITSGPSATIASWPTSSRCRTKSRNR